MRFQRALFVAAAAIITALPALASPPKVLGAFGRWTAYAFTAQGAPVCYMAAQPQKAEGNYRSRGDIFALVTHRPKDNSFDVFSLVAGYPYKKGSTVSVMIGGKGYQLLTQGDRAWTTDKASDAAVTQAVRRGSAMVVKGTSSRGTLTTDTYSLKGSAAAYKAISKACGVKEAR